MNYQKIWSNITNRIKKDLISKLSILKEAKSFSFGMFQNHLVFLSGKKSIKYFSGTIQFDTWKSNGMSEETIENITKSDSNFAPTFVDHHLLQCMIFNEHCLIKMIFLSLKNNKPIFSYMQTP